MEDSGIPIDCNYFNVVFNNYFLSSSSADYYIQKTRVPMLHFQPSLPRLPIPKLTDTCSRYLDAVEPVTTCEQFIRTQNIVNEFVKQDGEGEGIVHLLITSLYVIIITALDKQLREFDAINKHTSYVSEPWYKMYLSVRDPLVLNHNPFMAWKPDPNNNDQVYYRQTIIL